MDYEAIASQLLATFRGKRSQVQWSRRLGYKSNVAYTWESGRRWPTAAETFRAAARSGIDVEQALTQFYGARPAWMNEFEPSDPRGVARLLDELRGQATITDLARRAELSRYSVTRWLSAQTQPRLPDFLRAVQGASLRMVDLVAAFADPEQIPEISELWRRLEARRKGAAEVPWTQAVLRVLELESYRQQAIHSDGWVAELLGIEEEEATQALAFLELSGQTRWTGTTWIQEEQLAVDTRRHPSVGRRLKAHWSRVAADRVLAGSNGQFSYNVFTVSRTDFERIRELHLDYFHALRTIVGESEPCEVVAVANVQLFTLHPEDHNPELVVREP